MIAGLGPLEIVIILVIVLVIFGPKNLPKLGKSLGETVKNVREGMESEDEQLEGEVKTAIDDADADIDVAADYVEAVVEEPQAAAPTQVADLSQTDGVYCSKCGTKNASDAAFCSKCGSELVQSN